MIRVLHTYRRLVIQNDGHLVRWLGQAIRGLVGSELRPRVCRQPRALQGTLWRYCKGCPLREGCAYGETIEAAGEQNETLFHGQEDGFRPLAIHAAFQSSSGSPRLIGQGAQPAPYEFKARRGAEIPLRVTFVGEQAARHAPVFWQALEAAGSQPGQGLGDRNISFHLAPLRDDALAEVELPLRVDASREMLPSVRVELLSPLLMKWERDRTNNEWLRPDFGELLRASLRVLGGMHALYGHRIEADFAGLKQAALEVPTQRQEWRDYYQARQSNRARHLGMVHGLLGHAEFGPVPASLLPWLRWGGILGVGSHRVAGAGQWRVEIIS